MRFSLWIGWAMAACLFAPLVLWLLDLTAVVRGIRVDRAIAALLIGAAHLFVMYGCVRAIELRRMRILMVVGFSAGTVAMIAWCLEMYRLLDEFIAPPARAAVLGLLSTWSGFCGFTGLLSLSRITNRFAQAARRTAIAMLSLLAVNVAVLVVLPKPEPWLWQSVSVLVVLTLVAMACSRLTVSEASAPAGSAGPRWPFAVQCPRCGENQRLVAGGSACRACGLLIRVKIQ